MAKKRLWGALCLYFAAFQVGMWAEATMPEKRCFLQGDIVEISTKLTTTITLCFLSLLLNRRAEKGLSRETPTSHRPIVIIFLANAETLGQPNPEAKRPISSKHSGRQVGNGHVANFSRNERTNILALKRCGVFKDWQVI